MEIAKIQVTAGLRVDPVSAAAVAELRGFEDAIVETLAITCRRALAQTGYQRLVVSGGVGANKRLRAQLAGLGHPILGDRLYGSPFSARLDAIALFAVSLTVRHPTRDQPVTVRCTPPAEWPWLPLDTI